MSKWELAKAILPYIGAIGLAALLYFLPEWAPTAHGYIDRMIGAGTLAIVMIMFVRQRG